MPLDAPWSLYAHLVGVFAFTQLFRLVLVTFQPPPSRLRRSSNWLRS